MVPSFCSGWAGPHLRPPGLGQSDSTWRGRTYGTLAEDLDGVLTELELTDVTLLGFSMGGGEVARYVTTFREDRRSVGFAS
jgi:non-heme chloroperoxidase